MSAAGSDESTTARRGPPERKLVVAALVTDASGRVLLTRRLDSQPMGGLWELPGGKVEAGEAPVAALAREIEEELGCACRVGSIYEVVHHPYTRFELVMLVYRTELLGVPTPRQVAEVAWVAPVDLERYPVLPADVGIVSRIVRRGQVGGEAPSFDRLVRARVTGAYNAHYLAARLAEERDRAVRYGRPLSLVLIDVDDLGVINDRHGRAVGDQVLAQLAALLLASARTNDHLGHTSGAGFALVLPETSSGAALGIAERLRADVAARRFVTRGRAEGLEVAVRCTISCGVAAVRPGRASESDTLLSRADAALWRAKLGGRNRTLVEGKDSDPP